MMMLMVTIMTVAHPFVRDDDDDADDDADGDNYDFTHLAHCRIHSFLISAIFA